MSADLVKYATLYYLAYLTRSVTTCQVCAWCCWVCAQICSSICTYDQIYNTLSYLIKYETIRYVQIWPCMQYGFISDQIWNGAHCFQVVYLSKYTNSYLIIFATTLEVYHIWANMQTTYAKWTMIEYLSKCATCKCGQICSNDWNKFDLAELFLPSAFVPSDSYKNRAGLPSVT